MTASLTLSAGGVVCVFLSVLILFQALPRDGRPPTAWTRTDGRAMSTAILFLILVLSGMTMVIKGIF